MCIMYTKINRGIHVWNVHTVEKNGLCVKCEHSLVEKWCVKLAHSLVEQLVCEVWAQIRKVRDV